MTAKPHPRGDEPHRAAALAVLITFLCAFGTSLLLTLRAPRGARLFTYEATVVGGSSQFKVATRDANGALQLEQGEGPPARMRARFAPKPETNYLLEIDVESPREVRVGFVGKGYRADDQKVVFEPRPGVQTILLASGDAPPRARFFIDSPSAADIRVEKLELREVSGWYMPALQLLRGLLAALVLLGLWWLLRRQHSAAIILALIVQVALGVRVADLANGSFEVNDTRRFKIAAQLASTGELSYCNVYFPFCRPGNDKTASVGPVPIMVYAAAMAASPENHLFWVVAINLLASAVSVVLLYKLTLLIFAEGKAAFLAAALFALYPPFIRMVPLYEAETLCTVLVLASLVALASAMRRTGPRATALWIATGVLLGLASLSRTSVLYFGPLLALFLMAVLPVPWTRRLRPVAIFSLAFALTLSPWIIRNWRVFSAFVPTNTLVGYNMWRHSLVLDDDDFLRPGSRAEMKSAVEELIERRPDLRRNENEVEMDRIYRQEASRAIRGQPLRYLTLSAYRIVPLWTDFGGASSTGLRGSATIVSVANIALLALALFGGWQLRSKLHLLMPLAGLVAYVSFGHVLVNTQLRYLLPVLPIVQCLAAGGAIALFQRRQSRLV